jgi:hypothetical protein
LENSINESQIKKMKIEAHDDCINESEMNDIAHAPKESLKKKINNNGSKIPRLNLSGTSNGMSGI